MIETKTLEDKLNSAPMATSLLGIAALFVNGSGSLQKSYQTAPIPQTPYCSDANEATPGWMRAHATTQNLPADGNGGFILTMQYDAEAKLQVFCQFDSGGPHLYMRRRANKNWQSWKKIAFVA